MEFVEEEEKYSLVKYVEKYPNLFILKAVTKFWTSRNKTWIWPNKQ